MPDLQDHNQLPDEFSNLIRQKIEDYRIPVDSECWNEIEQRLQPKGKRSLWWMAGVAATVAVVIVSVLLLISPGNNGSFMQMAFNIEELQIKMPENPQAEMDTRKEDPARIKPVYRSVIRTTYIADNKTNKQNTSDTENNQNIDNQIQQIINTIDTVSLAGIPDNTLENNIPDKEPETKKSASDTNNDNKDEKGSKVGSQPPRILLPEKSKSSGNWLLAASVSSGGNSAAQTNNSNNMPLRDYSTSSLKHKEQMYVLYNEQRLPEEEFSDVDHSLPLTFGVSVRKDLNSRLGIETGLNYTYLSTTMKKAGTPHYQAKQELHYLGIPLNLIVYLWNDNKWNVYLSAGGMAEKGIQGVYTQDMYLNGKKTADVKDKGSVSGMQWSLNASAGVSYSFYNDWGVYVEPRVSYYFDNNQPVSIRTDKSTVFGLGAGLRYKF